MAIQERALKKDCYTYRVTWSCEDEEYVGLCAEFPSLSWLANSQEEALHGIREVVAEVVEDMKSNDEPVPEPFAIKQFSGVVSLRIPQDLHRNITIQAAEAKISLNRFINYKLSL